MKSIDDLLAVRLVYTVYPDLALVRKQICITNTGSKDISIEGVNVEDFRSNFGSTHSQVYHSYGRFQALGTYCGNWDDPLIVVHQVREGRGIAIGNENIGILKRTSVFEDGSSFCVGTTMPRLPFPPLAYSGTKLEK